MTLVPSEEGVITVEVPASLGMDDAAGNVTEDDDPGHINNTFLNPYPCINMILLLHTH